MTGFGRSESTTPSGTFTVEIRGVNNRFLDIQMRIPKILYCLESKIKKFLSSKISRGSITLSITCNPENALARRTWDRKAVEDYVRLFNEIKKEHNLYDNIGISHLIGFGDIIKTDSVQFGDKALWNHISPILTSAVENFQEQREAEAAFISRDLKIMTKDLSGHLKKIKLRAPIRAKTLFDSYKKKVRQLAGSQVDPQRLAVEIAIMSDKLDISEECTRLKAHIQKLSESFNCDEPAGKRLGFILQEMNREANTISSKANDIAITHLSVSIKEIVEKMREQIQNIE